jgi:TP901 family phage tail tape measure protein
MAELTLNVRPQGLETGARRAVAALTLVKGAAFDTEDALVRTERVGALFGRGLILAAGAAITAFTVLGAAGLNAYRQQNKAIAEVSTLIEGTTEEIAQLEDASRRFASIYGGSATQQVNAFYQAISAGVGDVTEATEFLDTANRLAVAGVTDITTAVDLLTSSVNTYGSAGLTAARASDVLFVGVKVGKTTVDELSAALGRVLPVSAAAGASFEETVAAVAALTTGGLATAEAVTSVRAILSQVLKPTDEAAKLAEALGINFSVAGLQALGFSGFMQDVIDKTGGSTEALAQLFSSQEAIVGVLALAGDAGGVFSDTLVQMAGAAGVTDVAFQKVAQSLEQRLQVQLARLSNAALIIGEVFLRAIVPAMEAVSAVVTLVADNFEILISVMIGVAATQIPAMVTALVALVTNFGLVAAAASALSTVMAGLGVAFTLAGGPIGIALALLAGGAAYFLLFRDNAGLAEQAAYDAAAGTEALNSALGVFYGTAAPSAGKSAIDLANANYQLANSAYEAAEAELAKRRAILDSSNEAAAAAQDPEASLFLGGIAQEDFDRYKAQLEVVTKAEAALQQAIRDRKRAATAVTGAEFGEVSIPTDKLGADIQSILDQLNNSGGAASGAAGSVRDLRSAYDELMASMSPVNQAMREAEQAQILLNAARAAGVITDAEYAAGMDAIASRLRQAKVESDRLGQSVAQTMARIITDSENAGDAVRNLLSTLASQALTAGFQGLFSGAFSGIGKLFGFARGTNYFEGGTALVGEEGPEIVQLPRGTQIHSAGQSSLAETGGVVFNIDARGAQEGVAVQIQREMRKMVPLIQSLSVASVKDASRRGVR